MILYILHVKIISFVFEPRTLYKYRQSSKAQKKPLHIYPCMKEGMRLYIMRGNVVMVTICSGDETVRGFGAYGKLAQ